MLSEVLKGLGFEASGKFELNCISDAQLSMLYKVSKKARRFASWRGHKYPLLEYKKEKQLHFKPVGLIPLPVLFFFFVQLERDVTTLNSFYQSNKTPESELYIDRIFMLVEMLIALCYIWSRYN